MNNIHLIFQEKAYKTVEWIYEIQMRLYVIQYFGSYIITLTAYCLECHEFYHDVDEISLLEPMRSLTWFHVTSEGSMSPTWGDRCLTQEK